MVFFGLCSHGGGGVATKCTPVKISKTENGLSMKLSSHKHVSFVSSACLLLCLVCVTWYDQTPSNYVAIDNVTMAGKREKHISRTGYNDKRSITLTLPKYIMERSYLSSLLIKEKVFFMSYNEKHWSNGIETIRLINDSLVPYIKRVNEEKALSRYQKCLLIWDAFKAQSTTKNGRHICQLWHQNSRGIKEHDQFPTAFWSHHKLQIWNERFRNNECNPWNSHTIS